MSSYAEFEAAIAALTSDADRVEVRKQAAMASAYMWGVQDAGGEEKDTGRATEFGYAYGLHAARYRAGKVGNRENIAYAYKRWSDGMPIEEERLAPQ